MVKAFNGIEKGSTAYEPDDRIVIALDFGTTFSGIAYAFSNPGKKAEIVSILDWPGLEGHRQPKVPTLIHYDPYDPSKFKWGGQVDWRDPAVQGVKLLLDPDQPKPIYLPMANMKNDSKKLPKDPIDVAADFIRSIYNHALNKIEVAGVRDYFQLCQKQFVLTVPAVWSDLAKDRTLRAAKKAGIHPVTLIKEPEAAALYTLSVQERSLNTGDAFLVCDAGGGTVDLITYQLAAIQPTLELEEVVPGSGGMAGSLLLNKRFEEAVHDLVGDQKWMILKNEVGWYKASTEFDKNIKIAFQGDLEESYFVTFPKANLDDDPDNNLTDNCWEMTGKNVKELFDPVVKDIERMVDAQVKDALIKRQGKGLKGIFLVGGFGSCQYLKKCIQRMYPDIQVMQPPDAWAAIVKGAVMSRVSSHAAVTSTQAVRHYGVSAWSEYDPIIDKGQPKAYDLCHDGKIKCEKNTWYIYMGEDLKRDQAIKFPFFRTLDLNHRKEDLIFKDALLYSETRAPPNYPGADVKISCSLRADLSSMDKACFKKRTGTNGKTYYDVHYYLVISTQAANMKFSLEMEGMEIGSVETSYE